MVDLSPEAVERSANFCDEVARYFEKRDTGGEDKAHWANVYNAENARKAATLLRALWAGEKSNTSPPSC